MEFYLKFLYYGSRILKLFWDTLQRSAARQLLSFVVRFISEIQHKGLSFNIWAFVIRAHSQITFFSTSRVKFTLMQLFYWITDTCVAFGEVFKDAKLA